MNLFEVIFIKINIFIVGRHKCVIVKVQFLQSDYVGLNTD